MVRRSMLVAGFEKLIEVVVADADCAPANANAVVSKFAGLDQLVDAGRADVQPPGDLLDREEHYSHRCKLLA